MVTIAIVDDNPLDRERLASYLARVVEESALPLRPEQLSVVHFPDGRSLLDAGTADLDIVLLDIEMEPLNGIECARAIRKTDRSVVIVFVTNLFQFALEGYEVQALDFLVKPVLYGGFVSTMQRALQAVERRAPHYIAIEFGRMKSMVDVSTVTYVETLRKHLVVHTLAGRHNCGCSLRSIAQKLEPYGFAMPHQSYLVNLAHVQCIEAAEVLVAGEKVPLSRHKRQSFVQALTSYAGKVL